MKKTVLLTGANGLVGQKIVGLLANRRMVELVATGLGPNRNADRNGYIYHNLDVTDFEALKQLFQQYSFTEIIHCAAMTNVDQCEMEPDACRTLNVDSVRFLCGLCAESGARLIHLSTDFIFDGQNGPYSENDEAKPLSVYGRSKLDAERMILQSGIRAAIARTILVYGFSPTLSRSNIVLWVKSSLEKQQTIRVVSDQFRSPTLAEDLADGVVSILLSEKTGLFHLSGPEVMSILDIAYTVADFWSLDRSLIEPVESSSLSQPASRPPKTGFILLKAQTELNYQPHPLQKGLEILNRQLLEEAAS